MVRDVHHLVGATEIADILGVSRQRVQQLANEPGFPEPTAINSMGKIWTRHSVLAWAKRQGRDIADDYEPPLPPLPADLEDLARRIAALGEDQRAAMLTWIDHLIWAGE